MQFSWLEGVSKKWKDILVIGKTIERDGKKYHIIGMTMEEDAKLYIIEPYEELKRRNPKKAYTADDLKRAGNRKHQLFALPGI